MKCRNPKCDREQHTGRCEGTLGVATPVAMRVATMVERNALKRALIKSVEVKHAGRTSESERVQRWREANRERYNAQTRARRAKAKA